MKTKKIDKWKLHGGENLLFVDKENLSVHIYYNEETKRLEIVNYDDNLLEINIKFNKHTTRLIKRQFD